jgi:hypothetical protein
MPGRLPSAIVLAMTIIDYLVSTALVLLVIPQIRGDRLTMANAVRPVVLVAAAAAYYLHGIPTQGNDVLLDVLLAALGVAIGTSCALTTRLTAGADGVPFAKAGVAAAILWVLGMAGRFAFVYYSSHGGAHSVATFSINHQITSHEAWTVALILMALGEVVSRLTTIRIRGRMVTAAASRTLPVVRRA